MEFKFYNIDNSILNKINEYNLEYNDILNKILKDKNSNLDDLLEKRDCIEENILEILNTQKYIGYLNEDEYYDIESEFRTKYLGNNILDIQQINNMYNEIKIHDSELYENLKYILEKSIKEHKNIYILVK